MAMWKGGAGTPTPTLLSSRSRALSNPAVFSALVVKQQVTGVEQKAAGYREDSGWALPTHPFGEELEEAGWGVPWPVACP